MRTTYAQRQAARERARHRPQSLACGVVLTLAGVALLALGGLALATPSAEASASAYASAVLAVALGGLAAAGLGLGNLWAARP